MEETLTSLFGGPPISDIDEETFLLFSQSIPSQSLGFVDAHASSLALSIAGRDLEIRQSPGLLSSKRKEGTTGAVVWKVTPRFAEWIARPNFLYHVGALGPEATVLELGAGVAGVVALALGERVGRYVATDQDYVLKILRENVLGNQSSAAGGSTAKGKGKGKRQQQQGREASSNIHLLELDWETDSVLAVPQAAGIDREAGVDVVIACDCIYNEALIEPFVSTCKQACELRSKEVVERPTLCIVAQQLRSDEVFESWARCFHKSFQMWRLPDSVLSKDLGENSGFVVHVGILR